MNDIQTGGFVTPSLFKSHIQAANHWAGGATRDDVSHRTDKTIHKLSSNENLLGASPAAIRAIKSNLASLHEYRFQDDGRFRDALACAFDYAIGADQFLVANSGMELLDLICRGFLEPGDECIVSTPTFLAYGDFACLSGARTVDVPLDPASFSPDVESILAAVTDRTRLVFLGSPNNPTGSLVTIGELDRLLEGLPEHVVVVYDEVYHHYVTHPGFARAIDPIRKRRRVIGLHSFSKAHGLAGIRLGYIFSTISIIQYLRHLRRPFMINTLSMEAGMAALTDHEFIERTVATIGEEKNRLYDSLGGLGIPYWPSHANFILFRAPFTASRFAGEMLKQGIMLRTGDVFGASECIRVTVGTHEANSAFIDALYVLLT